MLVRFDLLIFGELIKPFTLISLSRYARAYFEHKLTILEDSAPGDLKNFLLAGKFANRFDTVIDVPNGDP